MNEFISGFMVGVILLYLLLATVPQSLIVRAYAVLTPCEMELPRNKKCELTAQPVEKIND